jgi:choloylglycine hydrolase
MRIKIGIASVISALIFSHHVDACTDFRLKAVDGSTLITRSMEFALDLKSNLRTSNRGRVFSTLAPDNKPGLNWTAKYGYVFLDGLNVDMAIDGMNEKGLSFEALYLPTKAEYQTVPAGHDKEALPYFNFGDWVLSNFATVDEVKAALNKVYVYTRNIPEVGNNIFPLHFSIYDASGKGIVVEYVGGKMNIYDNEVGVLTNTPTYDWHITNLINYVNLMPHNPNPVMLNGITFAATGQGFGMIGIPGDISPPSRFVKTATLLRVVISAPEIKTALNLAEHIINNVDIPLGLARTDDKSSYTSEKTQWVVFKDLTHLAFYYRTYEDMTLRMVDMSKLNFNSDAPRLKMGIFSNQYIQDKTSDFLKSR